MFILVSFLPIILPFIFLVLLKMSAKTGMSLTLFILIMCAFFIWNMNATVITSSVIQGIHKAFGILLILYGAIFMMNVLKKNGAVNRINLGFNRLTKDMRVQAVLIAYLFGALIEGVAGFGTPAVVVAPLLVALGFSPIAAATLALVSNSVPVPFAAVGTPIQIGLSNLESISGYSTASEFFNAVTSYITQIGFLSGIFMPTIVIFMLLFFFGKGSKKREYLEILPWSLMIGFIYMLCAYLSAMLLGYEFVSIISSIATLVFATISIRFRILTPKNAWVRAKQEIAEIEHSSMSLFKAWLPYGIVIILLVVSRTIPFIKSFFLNALDLSLYKILGVDGIDSKLQLLNSPGFILIIAALVAIIIYKGSFKSIVDVSKKSLLSVKSAALALFPALALVQIFSNSGINGSEFASMPVYLATFLGEHLNSFWIIFAPFIGELGSFITGSATVSTLTFSPVQFQIAQQYGLNPELILGLQLIGGSAGNMIGINNAVSVSTVLNIVGKEGIIIKKTIFPAILYALLAGIAALIIF